MGRFFRFHWHNRTGFGFTAFNNPDADWGRSHPLRKEYSENTCQATELELIVKIKATERALYASSRHVRRRFDRNISIRCARVVGRANVIGSLGPAVGRIGRVHLARPADRPGSP